MLGKLDCSLESKSESMRKAYNPTLHICNVQSLEVQDPRAKFPKPVPRSKGEHPFKDRHAKSEPQQKVSEPLPQEVSFARFPLG